MYARAPATKENQDQVANIMGIREFLDVRDQVVILHNNSRGTCMILGNYIVRELNQCPHRDNLGMRVNPMGLYDIDGLVQDCSISRALENGDTAVFH